MGRSQRIGLIVAAVIVAVVAIVVLSGEGTDFINGEVIGVDGGEFITGS